MLDQADYLASHDKNNVLAVVAAQAEQLKESFASVEASSKAEIRSIVVAGMGGSALAAAFIQTWLRDKLTVPFEICRSYELPAYVGRDTLVVASSYSGNTEETVSALAVAEKAGAQIVVMAAGGKLAEAAQAKKYPYYQLPGGSQPRFSVLWGVKALALILEAAGLAAGVSAELDTSAGWLAEQLGIWAPGVNGEANVAKRIAEKLHGSPVVIYGGPALASAVYKWKIDFNENAKNISFNDLLSELDHNEIEGWSHPGDAGIKLVELHSSLDNPQINKRYAIGDKLSTGLPTPIIVNAEGETHLQQLLWTQLLGDFVSVYVALLNEVDPSAVPIMEELKRELAD